MRYVGVRIAKTLFGKVYEDLAVMEDVLRDSSLDWTVLRPPQLTGKPFTGRYRTAVGRPVRPARQRCPLHARRPRPVGNHRPDHRHRNVINAVLHQGRQQCN
jgi:hypothetical protein